MLMFMQDSFALVYKIPYRRARAWPSGCIGRVRRASKGILHTSFAHARTRPKGRTGSHLASTRATLGHLYSNAHATRSKQSLPENPKGSILQDTLSSRAALGLPAFRPSTSREQRYIAYKFYNCPTSCGGDLDPASKIIQLTPFSYF